MRKQEGGWRRRVSRGSSCPSRGHRRGRQRTYRGIHENCFYARFASSPDTTTTCARDDGRDDTAPYWTALRKYNGAPLLRCVHPNHDVGVGATPPPRSAPCAPPPSRLVPVGRLFFPILLSLVPPPPPGHSARNEDYPLTCLPLCRSPAVLAAPLVVVLLFLSSWSPF